MVFVAEVPTIGDALLVALPNGEVDGDVFAAPNIIPDFGVPVSNIVPGGADAPNPVALPPKIFPLGGDNGVDPKTELLLPPNIEVFEDVGADTLENTELAVLPNGVDAGLIIGFAKTFSADDADI